MMHRIATIVLKLVVYYSPLWLVATLIRLFCVMAAPHFGSVAANPETGQTFLIEATRAHPILYVTHTYYLAFTASLAMFFIGLAFVLLMLALMIASRFRYGSASK